MPLCGRRSPKQTPARDYPVSGGASSIVKPGLSAGVHTSSTELVEKLMSMAPATVPQASKPVWGQKATVLDLSRLFMAVVVERGC